MSIKYRRFLLTILTIMLLVMAIGCAPSTSDEKIDIDKETSDTKKENVVIEMAGGELGSLGYVMIHATADLIKKHSTWLQAVDFEVSGITENLRIVAGDQEKKKNFVYRSDLLTSYQAKIGEDPFEAPYTSEKFIAKMFDMPTPFATLDSNIN